MTYIACRRGGSAGSQLHKISILFDKADEISPGQYFRETDKAIGFKFNGEMIWIPKSQIQEFHYQGDPARIEFWCPRWLIEAKSLELFIDTSHEPSLFEGNN